MKERLEAELVGIAQAAQIIGMHFMTLGKLVREGAVRGQKTENGHWVIPESEVKRCAAVIRKAKECHVNAGKFHCGRLPSPQFLPDECR